MLAVYDGFAFTISGTTMVLAPAATIEVRNQDDNALASIYSDEAGTTPITNPSAFCDAEGRFKFFAAGRLRGYKVQITDGAFSYQRTVQPVGTAAQVDVTTFTASLLAAADAAAARTLLGFGSASAYEVSPYKLLSMLHANTKTSRRDMVKMGFLPAMFNQRWGGGTASFEITEGVTGALHSFDSMCYYVDNAPDNTGGVGNAAATTWRAQGFKLGDSRSIAAIWVFIYKNGNPTANLELRILPDDGTGKPSGSTAISNGTATAQSGRAHSTEGSWVRFVFPTPPSLTVDTQYHIALKSSAAVDASNHWFWPSRLVTAHPGGEFPFGAGCNGDGTPTWSTTVQQRPFIVEMGATNFVSTQSGIFGDGRINFSNYGDPTGKRNQLAARARPAAVINGFDPSEFTLLMRVQNLGSNDKTVWDMGLALDHDRIVLSQLGSGAWQVDVYEADGTRHTVTQASGSNNEEVAIHVRAKGDGADRIDLIIDGAVNGAAVTSATITFSDSFKRLATEWLGGGFPRAAPTWSQKLNMDVLPSADSPAWTYVGAASESVAYSAAGKLWQQRASTSDGFYRRTALSLSNANGWAVQTGLRVSGSPSAKDATGCSIAVFDGTKTIVANFGEYFAQVTGEASMYPHSDMKYDEHTMLFIGKGADAMLFKNNRLLADQHTRMTAASGSNQIEFGDRSTTESADAVWDNFAYYNTAWVQPMDAYWAVSEYALWAGDAREILATLYNGGSEVSVKQFTGQPRNYYGDAGSLISSVDAITASPTVTVVHPDSDNLPEMAMHVYGDEVKAEFSQQLTNSSAANISYSHILLDGVDIGGNADTLGNGSVVGGDGANHSLATGGARKTYFGPHVVRARAAVSAGTLTSLRRRLTAEARTA